MQIFREIWESRQTIERKCVVERDGDIEIESRGIPALVRLPITFCIDEGSYMQGIYGFSLDPFRHKFTERGLMTPSWDAFCEVMSRTYGPIMRMRLYGAIARKAQTLTTVEECMNIFLHGPQKKGGELIQLSDYLTPRQRR